MDASYPWILSAKYKIDIFVENINKTRLKMANYFHGNEKQRISKKRNNRAFPYRNTMANIIPDNEFRLCKTLGQSQGMCWLEYQELLQVRKLPAQFSFPKMPYVAFIWTIPKAKGTMDSINNSCSNFRFMIT